MIEIIAEPRITKTWNQFIKENPSYSIALDGYVSDQTRYDNKKIRLNINHHENVDRLSTKSTSAQVYLLIKQGLFEKFKDENGIRANIFINDCDEDVTLSIWLLLNHKRISKKNEYLIERLVDIEDKLDITGGTYPFDPNSDVMKEIAWIFEPYKKSKISGLIEKMSPDEMKALIKKVLIRIDYYCNGKGKKINLDTRYNIVYQSKEWAMINEIGPYARMNLIKNKINASVSVRKRLDKNYAYTLIKINPFVYFPIELIYKKLNKIEKISSKQNDRWSGSNSICGSPRKRGSKIHPNDIILIINGLLRN